MGHTDTGGTEAMDFVVVRHDAVSDPRPVGAPARALEIFHGPTTERRDREVVVLGVLGEVRVQTNVEFLGEFGRAHHELLGHAER